MADPVEPNTSGVENPDAGKNFDYLVPNLNVVWPTPPSFNLAPPDPDKNGEEPLAVDAPPCGPIKMNAPGVRDGENRMLNSARTTVARYQALRDLVMSTKDVAFGQNATVVHYKGGTGGYNGAGAGVREEVTENSPIHAQAVEFAANINPAQEKLLWQIANVHALMGQYIAAVNRAGQVYAATDRRSRFPAPPDGPVQST